MAGVRGDQRVGPLVAVSYVLASTPAKTATPAAFPYKHPTGFHDVTSGSTGTCGNYLCNAITGYDWPTGVGTPHGLSAFTAAAPPAGFTATGPTRVLDTRYGTGAPAVPLRAGTSIVLTILGLPTGATGIVLNLTATNLTGTPGTFIAACPAAQPVAVCAGTTVLNPTTGLPLANEVTVPVASDGQVQLYNNVGSADLVGHLGA